MDKSSERETRDFMSVESFSQLPFIRAAPLSRGAPSGIRLFGQEFGTTTTPKTDDEPDSDNAQEAAADANKADGADSRKFECHYCCRNFPTSQALGGHQNAHKRERQQAKRAHLQSAMLHGGLPDPHVYGLMTYTRLASAPPPLPLPYHSWTGGGGGTTAYSAGSRIYGAQPQPINGSPLTYWRVPPPAQFAGRDRPAPPPPSAFGFKDEMRPLPSSMSGISGSQFGFGYESKGKMQEHVSLDLHL